LEVLPDFLQGDRLFSVIFCSGGARERTRRVLPPRPRRSGLTPLRSQFFLRCLGRPCCSLMRPGRSPCARSGSEFLRWFVDVVNSLAVAWCESSPRAFARSERTIKDRLSFYCTPLHRLSARRKGESAVLPSEGTEHGISSELLTGDPSGCPSPVR
jgi:hypothetical protein